MFFSRVWARSLIRLCKVIRGWIALDGRQAPAVKVHLASTMVRNGPAVTPWLRRLAPEDTLLSLLWATDIARVRGTANYERSFVNDCQR